MTRSDRAPRNHAIKLALALSLVTPLAGLTTVGSASADAVVPLGGTCPVDAPTASVGTALTTNANIDWYLRYVAAIQAAPAGTYVPDPFIASDIVSDGDSMYNTAKEIGAPTYYASNSFGQGVDVALIDTGVAPVPGLDNGNVVHAIDVSFESQSPYAHVDTYGHGTHLASIIAGRDDTDPTASPTHAPYGWNDPAKFTGIAPGARVVSIKAADAQGAVDVTQVIAAVDWAVKHAHDAPSASNPKGFNIRVINLSVGFDASPYDSAATDALSYAVEQAWNAGIVVVAATGNNGRMLSGSGINSPAFNPDVIAVGGFDGAVLQGGPFPTYPSGATSSNRRLPDFAAPGQSILGLHDSGAALDEEILADCATALAAGHAWTQPVVGLYGRYVHGSGTSQSAAVASGAVAVMLSRNPSLTPDQVKSILRRSAQLIPGSPGRSVVGEGRISLTNASTQSAGSLQTHLLMAGATSLDAARGYSFLTDGTMKTTEVIPGACSPTAVYPLNLYCLTQPVTLSGNVDMFGNPINLPTLEFSEFWRTAWMTDAATGVETWGGTNLTVGPGLAPDPILGSAWQGRSWSGRSWTGRSWSDFDWSGRSWSGRSWTGRSWSGRSWTGRSWSGRSWSDNAWS